MELYPDNDPRDTCDGPCLHLRASLLIPALRLERPLFVEHPGGAGACARLMEASASLWIPDESNYGACAGHGTHVAGILGANGNVVGQAPDVSFGVPMRTFALCH